MEMKEWIKEQQRRYLDEPRLKELTEVMKQTRVLVRKKEYRKLTELVRRYRKSEDVITQVSCLLLASYLFPTPEKTAETDRSELMEALKDTYFMEKNGSRLMDIRPEEAVPVHRMLAMFTFMQDVYSKENPESKQERPSPQEVRSSVRILDFHRKESAAIRRPSSSTRRARSGSGSCGMPSVIRIATARWRMPGRARNRSWRRSTNPVR